MHITQNRKRMEQKYNLDTLLDDIQSGIENLTDNAIANDKAKRENKHKLIIIQMLAKLAQTYGGGEYNDDEKLRRDIVTKLNLDEVLSGFLFFVSQNPQFDYSWSYMRKRKSSYADFLVDSIRFMNEVVADINALAGEATEEKEIHVVLNDLFVVELGNVEPFVKTMMKWENLQRMATVKKGYSVSVCKKDNVLATGNRIEAEDVVRIKEKALERLVKSRKDTNGTII